MKAIQISHTLHDQPLRTCRQPVRLDHFRIIIRHVAIVRAFGPVGGARARGRLSLHRFSAASARRGDLSRLINDIGYRDKGYNPEKDFKASARFLINGVCSRPGRSRDRRRAQRGTRCGVGRAAMRATGRPVANGLSAILARKQCHALLPRAPKGSSFRNLRGQAIELCGFICPSPSASSRPNGGWLRKRWG
jgi:hypothetical protein